MTDPAQPIIRQGPATPDGTQLPEGAASQVNASVTQAEEALQAPQNPQNNPNVIIPTGGTSAPPGASGAPETGSQELPLPVFSPVPRQGPVPLTNENENALFGPTSRPQESVATGALTTGRMPVPPEVYQSLPALQTAAKIPGAPKQLIGLVELLNHLLSQ